MSDYCITPAISSLACNRALNTVNHAEEEEPEPDVGPALPAAADSDEAEDARAEGGASESDSESESEDDIQEAQESLGVPISNEVVLEHGVKPVSAIGLDPAGARLVTGGYDALVKFWDFPGMNSSLQSFREIEPFDK